LNKIDRANELIHLLNRYDEKYFSESISEISDEEYDNLWFELYDLLKDKEVQKASKKKVMPLAAENSHLAKVQHLVPVLSLDKLKMNDKKFEHHLNRFVDKYSTGDEWSIQSKLDGLTIVIYRYKHKIIFCTRGGGQKGEDVTNQFKAIPKIWQAAQNLPEKMIVRGEAIISKENFQSINEQLDADNQYQNARNCASSSVRTLDTNTALNHHVDFVAYDILNSEQFNLTDEKTILNELSHYGFDVVENQIVQTSNLKSFFDNDKHEEWRDNEELEIDGLVIKPNIKIVNPEINGHHQKGQLALKYKPQTAQSKLLEVNWKVGSNGRMTPVASFEPVSIGGSTISSASLGSWGTIKKLDLKINDSILIARSNDVIPQIDSVITEERSGDEIDIDLPENSRLDGAIVYANDYEMPLEEKLDRYANAVKIESAKKSTFKKIIDKGYLSELTDLYELSKYENELKDIKGLGSKKVESLLSEIEYSKEASLQQILVGLNITDLGQQSINKITSRYPTWNELKNATDLTGLNYKNKDALVQLQDTTNQNHQILNQLASKGVNMQAK
jgi:DNA ligase (NAD+)